MLQEPLASRSQTTVLRDWSVMSLSLFLSPVSPKDRIFLHSQFASDLWLVPCLWFGIATLMHRHAWNGWFASFSVPRNPAEDQIPRLCTGRESVFCRKWLTSRDLRANTVRWGCSRRGVGGRGCKPDARALALVLNPDPRPSLSQRPQDNLGRVVGQRPVLGAPSKAAGRKLGRAGGLGPSTGGARGWLISFPELGKFCPTVFFFNIYYFGNWRCLLPSHLSRHGDSSFFFLFLQAKWAKLH